MFIKQVIIEGFKSYKEQVAAEPFSSKHNCVVGANGSGKTNFFHAIRFVLSDLFHDLRAEHRQALLHEGAGHQVMSAFVEIVFDNTDNRMPVDREEVRLRRTIGLKKDEYFLDKKHITKTEVMNLLESAGFSRSNPYYVVQQGKIASLTLMKDKERLDLLKEIGGTRVYEERRKESLKILQDTENRRKQIVEVVQYIEERLKELDEEKEELRKYQVLDKQRRSLEYTIFEKELLDVRQRLDETEEAREKVSEKSSTMHNSVLESHEQSKEMEKTLKSLTKELQSMNKEKDYAERQRTEAFRNYAKLESDVRDMEDGMKSEARTKEEFVRELQILEKEIWRSKQDLERVSPLYQQYIQEEEEISKGISNREKELSILYQKQGRTTQFADKGARDSFLQREVDDLRDGIRELNEQIGTLEIEMQKLNTELQALARDGVASTNALHEQESHVAQCESQAAALKAERDHLADTRKNLWQQETQLSQDIDRLRAESQKAEKSLEHLAPGDIRRGLASIRRICKERNITGVHGPLFELLECEEKFYTAAEVTAGNSFYHVVVDVDEVSTKIINYLSKEKAGRVTFIPLNKVRAPHVVYPSSPDVVPLLNYLKYHPQYAPAFGQVFGRTVICRDMEVATKIARTSEVDCITLEGDQVHKRGALTGGFYDYKRSKLKLVKMARENTRLIGQKQEELDKVRFSLQDLEQKINNVMSELQKLDANKGHYRSQCEQLKNDISSFRREEMIKCRPLENKKKLIANAQEQIKQLEASIVIKQREMQTDLVGQLTDEEKYQLSCLNPEITLLKEKLIGCRASRMEAEMRKSELETLLSTNLVRRQVELEAQIAAIDPKTLEADLERKKEELRNAKASVDEDTLHLKSITDQIDKHTRQIQHIKTSKDELKALQDNYEQTLQDEAKELEQLLSKRSLLQAKREDLMKKIRDLGSLPSDAFEKYQRKSLKELHKMLHRCNEQLKSFSHVNKKALDQYVNFTEQREELHLRQAELDSGDEKIRELISVLDQRKDESIERTFKGVAKNFREAFAELVPGGNGSLVMMKKRRMDEAEDEDADDDGDREGDPDRVEKYVGVKVKVSFTGQGETQSMKQLSGGQKTVVALTLIFAIQRCDPAPFYLFDEIDAALDPQYRTAVGNMIKRQADSSQTQFITTTFRPELVKVADKIYGVTHKNRVSRVDVISKEDALYFIEHDQSHQP